MNQIASRAAVTRKQIGNDGHGIRAGLDHGGAVRPADASDGDQRLGGHATRRPDAFDADHGIWIELRCSREDGSYGYVVRRAIGGPAKLILAVRRHPDESLRPERGAGLGWG